jgi:tripartite-type tricarboxylate transporter receptor subunit TctC
MEFLLVTRSLCRRLASKTVALACLFAAFTASAAFADDTYPSRPLRLIVAYPAGGGTDVMARLYGEQLEARLKQRVIVENRVGGGGILGANAVAKAPTDGYTLLFSAISELTVPSLLAKEIPYSLADFRPIGRIAHSPFALIVGRDFPATTFAEFKTATEQRPTPTMLSASANYSALTGGLFKLQSGFNLSPIRYRGSAQVLVDLMGGHVHAGFETIAITLPQAKDGGVKMLAIAAEKRSPLAPEIPTLGEVGYPNVIGGAWYGVLVPKDTTPEVVQLLEGTTTAILASQEFRKDLTKQGFDPYPDDTPAAFGRFLEDEKVKWEAVADKVGLRP